MSKPVHIAPECRNCGHLIQGARYCGNCGQEHLVELYSLKELAGHYAEDFLSLDSRLLRSLWPLLVRPAYLTQQYKLGRRNQFIRPLRLYLLSSILFFTVFFLRYDPSEAVQIQDSRSQLDLDDDEFLGLDEELVEASDAATDSTKAADEGTGVDISLFRLPGLPAVNSWIEEREKKLEEMSVQDVVRVLIDGGIHHAPKAILLLVPVVAWVLKILYVRRMRYYMEHFIFALHWHSFLFLLFTVVMFVPWGWARAAMILLSPIYLLLALRRYYEQGWVRTLIKHQLIMNSYVILLPMFAVGLALVAALTV